MTQCGIPVVHEKQSTQRLLFPAILRMRKSFFSVGVGALDHMDGSSVWMFGFGSNMNLSALQHKGITVLESFGAKVCDYELFFGKGNGMASITRQPGSIVYGACFRISEADKRRLDMLEGGDAIYQHAKVSAKSLDESMVVSVNVYSHPEGKPVEKVSKNKKNPLFF